MKKKSITNVAVKGKTVFLRVDFNVPMDSNLKITDDTRIQATLPTFQYLINEGAKIVCASHLGRPKNEKDLKYSTKPTAERLSQLISQEVKFPGELTGPNVDQAKAQLKPGEVLMLENLRFNPGETENNAEFAKELAKNIDVYVNDAFGASHRAHSSIQKITEFVPVSVAGFLLKKEIEFLSMATENPPKNYTVIMGGAKVSDKIPLINNLLGKANKFLIGGAMAYTFMKAKGIDVGNSRVETESIDTCKEIIARAEEKNVQLFLPIDHVTAVNIEPEVTVMMISKGKIIPPDMMGLDIGFDTIALYTKEIKDSELIVWNGPMGVFEIQNFSAGTLEVAKAVAESHATTLIGGGDTISAVNMAGVAEKITHISTGGGASLEFLAGDKLPGIESLSEA